MRSLAQNTILLLAIGFSPLATHGFNVPFLHTHQQQQQPLLSSMDTDKGGYTVNPMPDSDFGLFGGIATYAHLPYEQCWEPNAAFDIAFVGAPFDTCNMNLLYGYTCYTVADSLFFFLYSDNVSSWCSLRAVCHS